MVGKAIGWLALEGGTFLLANWPNAANGIAMIYRFEATCQKATSSSVVVEIHDGQHQDRT